jgi:peroxiredoxin
MKKHKTIIITACFFCVVFRGYTQTGIKGTIINAEQIDSIALVNPFNKQSLPLEKVSLGKKGSFEFKYKPSEIGFYYISFLNGKMILVVLRPNGSGQVEIDASTGLITKVTDSEQNLLLKSFYEMSAGYDKRQKDLEMENKPIEQKQSEGRLIEQERWQAIQKLLLKNTTNYASAALIDHLSIDDFLIVHDSVLTTLIKKYPDDGFVKTRYHQTLVPAKKLAIGYPAPEITLQDTAGNSFSLSSLKGKVVLIDFWAAWCRPCRMENPNMVRLYNTYKKYGFDILGVSLDNNRENWLRAIQTDGLVWHQVSDLKGWQSAAGQLYGVVSIPFTVLVDKNGNIIAKGLRGETLEQKLKELLLEQ